MINRIVETLRAMDPNQRNYWLGLLLLFAGLTGLISMFMALMVTGAVMIVESTITSYMAALINARKQ